MESQRILVVDDTEMNVKLLTVLLQAHGHHVESVATAEDAAPLLARSRFDCVLLDISLPGMDGLSFARQLRRDPAHAGLVIIAVTANAMKGDKEEALAAGCNAYVAKPIDTRTFTEFVGEQIARARYMTKSDSFRSN